MSSQAFRADLDAALLAADPAAAVRTLLEDGRLDRLAPEIRREMDVPQRTHYHHLTVLEHSLATMAAMPPRLDERLAGLLHDIGKRRTTSIKPRTGEEQYIGHARVSADIARSMLERLGYEPALVDRVCRWIALHMDLHIAVRDAHSPAARRRVLDRAGGDLEVLQRLQLADIDAMALDFARETRPKAVAYHRALAEPS